MLNFECHTAAAPFAGDPWQILAAFVVKDPADYDSRANLMWAATMALKGTSGPGVPKVELLVWQLEAHGMTPLGEREDVTPAVSREVYEVSL